MKNLIDNDQISSAIAAHEIGMEVLNQIADTNGAMQHIIRASIANSIPTYYTGLAQELNNYNDSLADVVYEIRDEIKQILNEPTEDLQLCLNLDHK